MNGRTDAEARVCRELALRGVGRGALDARFLPHGDDFRGLRVHQTRLQGGDASSDSHRFVD
jgi:selenium-binding protein 1